MQAAGRSFATGKPGWRRSQIPFTPDRSYRRCRCHDSSFVCPDHWTSRATLSSPFHANTSAVHFSPSGVFPVTSVWASQPAWRAALSARALRCRCTGVSGFQSHAPLALCAKNRVPSFEVLSTARAGQQGMRRFRSLRERSRSENHSSSEHLSASMTVPSSSMHRSGMFPPLLEKGAIGWGSYRPSP